MTAEAEADLAGAVGEGGSLPKANGLTLEIRRSQESTETSRMNMDGVYRSAAGKI
jgi:hypothetical protein